jgi:hypothetical protein
VTVRVVVSYFRSGGTLLNRCLGALPNVVIMSEVSPLKTGNGAGLATVRQQAEEWYGIRLKHDGFLESIDELHGICESVSKHLVLRLWVVGEFARGGPAGSEPTYRLSAYHSLCEAFPDVRAVALVRDAIDIWISRGCRPPGFFSNYRRYVEALLSERIPIEKYESLCQDPDASMLRICEALELPFSSQYRQFHDFNQARGDLTVESSRARGDTRVRTLKRRRIDARSVRFMQGSEDMIAANRALGYPTGYDEVELESRLVTLARWLQGGIGTRFPALAGIFRNGA